MNRTALLSSAAAVLVLAAPSSTPPARAADAPATVAGFVRDAESDRPLAGVLVTLVELERTGTTDAEGRYIFPGVSPGPHHITFRVAGYSRHSAHALVPRTGTLEINALLRVDPVHIEGVDVRAPVPVRGLARSDSASFPDRAISAHEVRHHPVLAEPDVFQALGGGEVVLQLESSAGVHVQGGASDQTGYVLEGVPIWNPYHAAGVWSAWNPDALSTTRLGSEVLSLRPPHALAGTIAGSALTTGRHLRAQGTVSTTQARLTLDGPIGGSGTSFLLALRAGLHDLIAPEDDASYLDGGTGDLWGDLRAPLLGGEVHLLGYGNVNEIGASAEPDTNGLADRHSFEWESYSLGAEWRRTLSRTIVHVQGWGAFADEAATWAAPVEASLLDASRRDVGGLAAADFRSDRVTTSASIRFEQSRTNYDVTSRADGSTLRSLDATTPITTAAVRQVRSLGHGWEGELGGSLAISRDEWHPGLRAQLAWRVLETLTLTARYARTHQFAQSLRNPESVVGEIFPADLYVGSGSPEVPVADSDQWKLAAEYRPAAGIRWGFVAYARESNGLVLTAPREGGPYATGPLVHGSSDARGLALDFAASGTRYGVLATYGVQRVRHEYGDSSYTPQFGARHHLEGGVVAFPTATVSVRFGLAAAFGRRATVAAGPIEWESCNLLDRGCEFVGSPTTDGEPLGGAELPSYVRLDLGLRKHWHLRHGAHDTEIALFGSFTNLLARDNLLTYARDPITRSLSGVELRPSAPFVVGVDVRY